MKKAIVIFMSLLVTVLSLSGCGGQASDSSNNSGTASQTVSVSSQNSSENEASQNSSVSSETSSETSSEASSHSESSYFSDADYKDVSSETPHAEIVFSDGSATISDTTRGSVSDKKVTITSKGIYKVSGSSEDISIVVDDSAKSGNVYIILDNVTMNTTSAPCIKVENADKVIIQAVGSNTLSFNSSDSSAKADGAVYAKDDVTINGSGTIQINSNLHGIVCKNDIRITGSSAVINAGSVGIKSEGTVRVGGGTVNITSGHDGVQVENDDNDAGFYFENAEMVVISGYDGISVKAGDSSKNFTGFVELNGGTLNISSPSGAGADASKDSSVSQKGIKTDGSITVTGTKIGISAADDAIHSNADITINSGDVTLRSGDDGITAAGNLTINGGYVIVGKSYEGLEAENVTINGGTVNITASDDGINCSGGSDTSSKDDDPWSSGNTNAKLTINGGNIYVNSEGDGLDSNGSIYVTGGTVIVEGPSSSGNGALDKGAGSGCVASITGGTVIAIGTSDMAINFDTGTQCSALVSLSGTEGTQISVDDGSGISFNATKSFSSVVYSSPELKEGGTCTITAGSSSAVADFTSGMYYSDVSGRGMGGRPW